jgi:hypothetical protein
MRGYERLIEANRQWPVQVRVWLDLDRHKLVPRYFGDRPEDPIVQSGLTNLVDKVLRDQSDRRNHLSSLVLKMGDAHKAPSSSECGRLSGMR